MFALEPVARALAYAHSHHVVHRDVKPSNILLRYSEPGAPYAIQLPALDRPIIPLLSDCGIARALDAPELTTAGRTIGTPAYMSPEQCAGTRNLDGRADIYSLATVLYRCLVGRPPFMGATTQILHAHVYEALTIPDAIAQALPPVMLQVLQRALQKSPEERYADMTLFADELSAMVRHIRTQAKGIEESTLTMPLLAVLPPEQEKKTAHVLVSGVTEQQIRSQPQVSRSDLPLDTGTASNAGMPHPLTGVRTTQSAALVKGRPVAKSFTKQPTRSRVRRAPRWVYLGIGTFLSFALIVLTVTAVLNILSDLSNSNAFGETQAAVATRTGVSTPEQPTAETAAGGSGAVAHATEQPTGNSPVARTPAPVVTAQVTATTSANGTAVQVSMPVSTPVAYDAGKIWQEDVLFFYRDREWRETRRRALEVFSTALQQQANVTVREVIQMPPDKQTELILSELLKNKEADFWKNWQPVIRPAEVEQVLFDTYVGIAHETNAQHNPDEALTYLDAALLIHADNELITNLRAATARYAYAIGEPKKLAGQALREAYQAYATQFAENKSFCAAAEYQKVAVEMLTAPTDEPDAASEPNATAEPAPITDPTLLSYLQQCGNDSVPQLAESEVPDTPLPWSFLYSTVDNGQYRIYQATFTDPTWSIELLIDNGAQPSISPNGQQLAFFSTRNDSQGLSLYDFNKPQSPQARFDRLSNFIEDAQESAPSWSPEGNRVVFSSKREGDRVERVFMTSVFEPRNAVTLDRGEDPAWGPQINGQSLVVYKGADETGNNPGLWLASETGRVRRLTTDESDRRPVWSPDGQYVVFMRLVDGINWELVRVRVVDGELLQLTHHPAQDGLPTISPDGKMVAFASDRDGQWAIWRVALEGGDEQRVMPIQGVLHNWLEHAIQWVK
ncbi:MAG: protein kinase [Caldilineaceae bacterium]